MLISKITPVMLGTLQLWDKSEQWVDGQVVWFDTDTMIASVVLCGKEQRVEIAHFRFNCTDEKQMLHIPKNLQQYIVLG